MKYKLTSIFLVLLFCACGYPQTVPVNIPTTPPAQTKVEESSNKNSEVTDNQAKTQNNQDSFECIRATPESILKKTHFVESNFTLRKNEEFPFEMLGFESAKFKNGDKLLVENVGCENYTLIFRFETERFSGSLSDTKYWYQTAVRLIKQTKKGIIDNAGLIKNGTQALDSYIRKNKKPAFNEEIDFGGKEIRSVVIISEPVKRVGKAVEIEISFGIGPL